MPSHDSPSRVSISIRVDASIEDAWEAWTSPEHITQWNFASEEWHCPSAVLELLVGGSLVHRMEARDGSMGFDFEGTITNVEAPRLLEFELADGRAVVVEFQAVAEGVTTVRESFDADDEASAEQQRQGWQAILENYKRHVETYFA